MEIQMQWIGEHIEVFEQNGTFLFSADSREEAMQELKKSL